MNAPAGICTQYSFEEGTVITFREPGFFATTIHHGSPAVNFDPTDNSDPADEAVAPTVHAWTCPWCESHKAPLPTADNLHRADFQHGRRTDAKHIARNPLMCDDCNGVGGVEDFADGPEAHAALDAQLKAAMA